MITIDGIEAFIAVANFKSFKKAAEHLHISAPTITLQIKALEERLKIQLLQRTTREVKLTRIGEQYLQRCRYIINELRTTEEWLRQLIDQPQGKLKIACFTSFWHSKVKHHIKDFILKYPKIELDLNLNESLPDLTKNEADLLIGVPLSIPVPDHWVRRKISSSQYCFAATKEYLKQHGTPLKPLDALNHCFITHTVRKPDNLLPIKSNKPILVKKLIKTNEFDAMVSLALDGLGIVWSHDYLFASHFKSGQFIELFSKYKQPKFPIYYYYLSSPHVNPTLRCFIDFIQNNVK